MQVLKRFTFVIIVSLLAACAAREIQYIPSAAIAVNASCDSIPHGHIDSVIRLYKTYIDSSFSKIIAVLPEAYSRSKPESNLGNLCADACLYKAYSVFHFSGNDTPVCCLLNYGGLRNPLPAGNVSRSNVFEVMPFDNTLTAIRLEGTDMLPVLDKIAQKGGEPVSNIRMVLSAGKWKEAFIGGQAFDTAQTYILVTSDYLAKGGDNYFFLKDKNRTQSKVLLRDAIAEYLQEGQWQHAESGRITVQK